MEPKIPRAATQPQSGWDDREDLDLLYRRHAKWLAAMLRRRFGHGFESEVEDVVQETYARLTPSSGKTIHKPQALLVRVALNLARDRLRRLAVRGRYAKEVREGLGPDLAPTTATPMDQLLFKEAILSVPEPYREVFILSRFGGLTYEEIATRCGLSVKSVEWRLSKAIAHCMKRD